MLATILIWCYLLILSYVYGWTLVDLLRRFFRLPVDTASVSKPLIVLAGLCALNVLGALLSLFINLSWLAQGICLAVGLIFAVRLARKQPQAFHLRTGKTPWPIWLLAGLIFLLVLENGTHPPVNPDTGIYHAQAIRWIETYPAVPGLGNLHSRFAFDSNWLVLNALFSFAFLGYRSFHVLPGLFVLVTLVYFLEGTARLLQGRTTVGNVVKTLLIPLVFFTEGSQISSPGTDLPAILLIWICLPLWLDTLDAGLESSKDGLRLEEVLVFLFALVALTVKLSATPLVLLAALAAFGRIRKAPGTFLRFAVLGLAILAPWFARNLILSGYWIYPVPALAALSPNWDWKIPLKHAIEEQQTIQAWARLPATDTAQVLAMPMSTWLKAWFFNLTRNQRLLVLAAFASPAAYILSAWVGLRDRNRFWRYSAAYLTAYCGLLFWLFSAPDIRFGFGFVLITSLLAVAPLLAWLVEKIPWKKALLIGAVLALACYLAFVLVRSTDVKTLAQRSLLPADYGSLATQPCSLHGYTLACAEYYNSCWYEPFPCVPAGNANAKVELRGAGLRDGFRIIDQP
jgi:hypothetical protein